MTSIILVVAASVDPKDFRIGLERAEWFRALDPERLERVLPRLEERRFERHQVLFFDGEPADFLWAVRRGEVRLYKSSPDGAITTLETLGPGEIFGALAAFEERSYPASAEALRPTRVWRLPVGVLVKLLGEDPGLALEILRIVSGRLREAHERVRSFAHDSAPVRLARALLRATRNGEARVTRRDLAEASGTTVETAIRVLRRFERRGLIRGEVGHVWVLDPAGLRGIGTDGGESALP